MWKKIKSASVCPFFPKRWQSGCIKVNRDDMCRCAREGGYERVWRWGGGGNPRRIPAGRKLGAVSRSGFLIRFFYPIFWSYFLILFFDPISRFCTEFSADNLILSTQRMRARGGDLAEKSSFTIGKRIAAECFLNGGRSCRKEQFYNSKTHVFLKYNS